MTEQGTQAGRQVLLCIFQQIRHLLTQAQWPSFERDPALQQKTTNLVDDLGTVVHQTFAYAMQTLQIELIRGLDGNEAQVPAGDSFGYRFRIQVVVLVRLAVALHELPWDQPNLMPLIA